MTLEIILSLSFFGLGCLEIVLAIPLILKKIPPNILYGFRVTKTLNNEKIWYDVNNRFGKDFLITGVLLSLGATIILITNIDFITASILYLILTLLPLFIIVVKSFIYLKRFD